MSSTNSKETTTGSPADAPAPSAKDVASCAAKLVDILAPLPPEMQRRALGAAATMLGLNTEQRSAAARTNANTNQQRNNTNQQRGGGAR